MISFALVVAFVKRFWREIGLAVVILGAAGYCHHRDTAHVEQGVRQERVRVADSVIRVTDTLTITQTKVLTKALSRADSQRIATRFELANAENERSIALPDASRSEDDYVRLPGDSPNDRQRVDTTLKHVVRVCNAQIESDSLALAAALSALHTCGVEKDAWKTKALAGVPPAPSRVKPFVAGALTGVAALVAVIHFVK